MKVDCKVCGKRFEERDAAIIDQVDSEPCTYVCKECVFEDITEPLDESEDRS